MSRIVVQAHRRKLAVIAVAGLVMVGYGQDASGTAPFTLGWLDGRCVDCKLALGLDQVQFTSAKEAWAVGCNFGPVGTGDYIVVHTKDAGRSWTEISETYQHAGTPAVSFLDARRGWIAWWNPADSPRIIRTADRGDHWEDVSDQPVQKLRFFDDTHGYGSQAAKFLKTEDGGHKWNETEIPKLKRIDRLFFLSPKVGWIAGTDGAGFLVFRTSDGGLTWEESRSPAPQQIDDIADLFFISAQRGWLITWHGDDGGTNLFSTMDAGKTWTRDGDVSFQGPHKWARVVRFLSPKAGFLFETAEPVDCPGCSARKRAQQANSNLVYTFDGGAHWNKEVIAHTVYDCQVLEGDLRCSAGSNRPGFILLTVHPK